MQLLDSSVFLVGTPGGEKKLPTKGNNGCHIEGRLLVFSEGNHQGIIQHYHPHLKAGGDCRKIILSPLAGYWIASCCKQVGHITSSNDSGYLTNLGDGTYRIGNVLHDCTHLKIIRKYKVV